MIVEHFGSCNCGEGMREVLSVTVGVDVILILVQRILLVDVSEVCDEYVF